MSRSGWRRTIALLFVGLGGCTSIPSLPEEGELPVQEIVTSATCELREAFARLADKKRHPNFRADEWAASISLTPKVDTDLGVNFSLTRRFPLITWTLGNPGIELDVRGRRDGSATFVLHSSDLLKKNARADQQCAERLRAAHALTQYHGVYEWWARLVPSDRSGLASFTKLDKPAFNSNIVVKFTFGDAGATWIVPNGTNSAALFGLRTLDLTLSMAFTRDPRRPRVVTLPEGGLKILAPKGPPEAVSPDALQRLDSIQTENILRNLRIEPQ
jgi:hypothetical protein